MKEAMEVSALTLFALVVILLLCFGVYYATASLGECGEYTGPGATRGWVSGCTQRRPYAECLADAERMGCKR